MACIKILVGQAGFKLWIKTVKIMFWSITQETLAKLNLNDIFEFLGQFFLRCTYILFFRC